MCAAADVLNLHFVANGTSAVGFLCQHITPQLPRVGHDLLAHARGNTSRDKAGQRRLRAGTVVASRAESGARGASDWMGLVPETCTRDGSSLAGRASLSEEKKSRYFF